MANDKVNMPSSGGGLVRYFDDFKSKININPVVLIVFICIVIIVEILLYKLV